MFSRALLAGVLCPGPYGQSVRELESKNTAALTSYCVTTSTEISTTDTSQGASIWSHTISTFFCTDNRHCRQLFCNKKMFNCFVLRTFSRNDTFCWQGRLLCKRIDVIHLLLLPKQNSKKISANKTKLFFFGLFAWHECDVFWTNTWCVFSFCEWEADARNVVHFSVQRSAKAGHIWCILTAFSFFPWFGQISADKIPCMKATFHAFVTLKILEKKNK